MRKLVIFPVGLLVTPKTNAIDVQFASFIAANAERNWFVAVSNKPKPAWFDENFPKVMFQQCTPGNGGSRRSGKIVKGLLDANQEKLKLQKSQVVILGYGLLDVGMYANSQSVLVRCDWRTDRDPSIMRYGIPCADIASLPHILTLLSEEHPWYFTHFDPVCDTYCLSNAATHVGSDAELKRLAAELQACLKHGNPKKRQDFIVALLSSLYATEVFRTTDLWSYYPSSSSKNDGTELISDFGELARTTFKRPKGKAPLFIRHTPKAPRHKSSPDDRENPASEIRSIHLHPSYKDALGGKTIVVLDDYTTTGVSFSVASAFLRKAGATKVLAVAMGKFPRASYILDIDLHGTPFAPVKDYKILRRIMQFGAIAPEASEAFKRKFN